LGLRRRIAAAFAVLAIVLKILTPTGFMLADQGSGLPLVICTGQGPLVIAEHGDQKAPTPKSADAPCAFASLGTALAPPLEGPVADVRPTSYLVRPATLGTRRLTVRRLAAPPPPSHAPPAYSELI